VLVQRMEGPTLMPEDERERALKAYKEATLAEDESLLMVKV
jgi:hypothetical protein